MIDEIRWRAYEIFEWRCKFGIEGTAEGDWLQAEAEIAAWHKWQEKWGKNAKPANGYESDT